MGREDDYTIEVGANLHDANLTNAVMPDGSTHK